MYAHKVTYKSKNKHIQITYELNMSIVMIFVKSPFKTYESQKLINIFEQNSWKWRIRQLSKQISY